MPESLLGLDVTPAQLALLEGKADQFLVQQCFVRENGDAYLVSKGFPEADSLAQGSILSGQPRGKPL